MSMPSPQKVIDFWFGKDFEEDPYQNSARWFAKDKAFDAEVRANFEEDLNRAVRGELDWKKDPLSRLAWIILLDQFSRNIYRDTPRMFAQDGLALAAVLEGIERKEDQSLHPVMRAFFYMPLMHSEDLEIQKRSVEMFQRMMEGAEKKWKRGLEMNYDYALKHYDIIARFGRFPHRNAILGRASTPEEVEFLKGPGSSF